MCTGKLARYCWALAALGWVLLSGGCAPVEAPAPTPLGAVAVASPTAATRQLETAQTEFGGLVRLEAARLLTPTVHPGELLSLELTWRQVRPTRRELQVIARLVDQGHQTRARRDVALGSQSGSAPTREDADARRTQIVELPTPASIQPGRYRLALAVLDQTNGVHVPISSEKGLPPVLIESQQILGFVQVTSPTY